MVAATRPSWRKSLWLALVTLVLALLAPAAAMAQDTCIEPNPVSFASKIDTPQIFLVGGGLNTDGHSNKCDIFDLALYQTNGANEESSNSFTTFTATSTNNVSVTFTYMSCNGVTAGGAGSGGCLPDGSGTFNTYYQLSLSPTTETTDTVTVFYDPGSSGAPTTPLVITLNINQAAATTTTLSSSVNPATFNQAETFTATVTSTSTVNEGTVTFSDNGSPISCSSPPPFSNGVASCTTILAVGSHPIVATYTGTANFATSPSSTLTEVVNTAVAAAQSIPSATLTQNTSVGSGFVPVSGSGGTAPLAYSINPALPTGLAIGSTTGRITGTSSVSHATSSFTVTVTDANSETAQNTFQLTVNPPVATAVAIASKTLTQTHAASFTPVTESGGTSPSTFSVSPMLPSGLAIAPSTGVISGTPSVTLAATSFSVTATDANGSFSSSSFSLTVNPAVAAAQVQSTMHLTQNRPASATPVTGSGGTIPLAYSINPALPTGLSIDSSTGTISGTPSVTHANSTFTVTVTDQNSATASNTFQLTVNAPVTAPTGGSPVALTQNHAPTPFAPVTSFTGGTTPYVYTINPTLPAGLSIDSSAGTISGTPSATLAATSFTVTATDANGSSAGNSFTLTVNTAVATSPVSASVVLTQNQPSLTGLATITASGGTGTLTYGISPTLPTGLSFDTTTGHITGSPSVTHAASSFTVTATDTNGASNASNFSLTVNQAVAASGGTVTANLTQNRPATAFTPVTGSNGTTPLAYSINPALPAGLSIDSSSGAVSGTPSATAVATTYTVTVTDANNATAANTFILTVNAPVTAPTGGSPVVLTQNHLATPFTPVTSFTGGALPYAYSISPTLPAGLSIDSSSGTISGTPSGTLAATSFTVTATDANGSSAGNSFSLTINQAVTATQAVPTEALTQNHLATSFTPVTGAHGTGTLAYSISPTLPTGLSLDTTSGAVSGTPSVTLSATSFTVTVTDANSATATANFSLTVNTVPTATIQVSQAFLTKNFTVTPFTPILGGGGTTPLAFSISPTLPAGLSISASTGAVSGTPSVISTATSYTVTVTDANGVTATNSFQVTVNGPVVATQVIASKGLTVEMVIATPFTPVTGSGGTGTLTYSVSPTLPPAVAMNPSTGLISGLPTVESAATTYTVTVTDQNSATATATFSLAVNGAVTASTAIASTTLTQNHASPPFTPVTGGGGTTPYTYSVLPALPSGLSLGSSTGAVTGAASVTSAAMSYTVTVTDANGATNATGFSLMVDPAVTATQAVAMTSIKVHQVATAFTPVTGGGGTGALVYSVSPSLPAGLSLASATGTISGTPTVTQSSTNYTMTVTDTNGATATAGFALAITTTTSSVTVTTSVNPSNYGQSVTFTAAVGGTGAVPTGTVTFTDGGTALFTGTLVKQLSSFTVSTLAPGTHSINVAYSGDSTFAGSSGGLTQVVGGAPTTPGQTYPYQGTLTGFSGPGKGLYDSVNDHLLICDTGNQRIEVLNAQSLATVATLGTTGVAGSDNAHLNDPTGVAYDSATNQIFVADTGNNRIQVFDAASFAYVETIGAQLTSDGRLEAAAANTAFTAPGGMHVDAGTGRLYIADTGNQRVQIFNTATLGYVGTLGASGIAGHDNAHFNAPTDVAVNSVANEILVADSGNSRVQRFDATSFAYKGTIGGAGLNVGDSDYLGSPTAVSYDATSNLVLVADSTEQRVEVFDALSYNYVLTLGTTGSAGSGNNQFSGPTGVMIDTAHQRVLVGDQRNNRVQIFSIAPTVAFASVLPGSRSVELGQPATIFASLINAGTTDLKGCQVALPVTAPSGLRLSYQTTNPATNALIGAPDTPATIPAKNGIQSFLVTLQGSQAFSAPGMALDFGCLGVAPAAVATGVDTVDLAMSTAPVADVIALAATASNNGIAEIPAGGASAFAVASSNVGATSQIVVSVDTGAASLPLTATLCQSNPSTGACLATPAPTVTLTDTAGSAPTFSVFLQANGTIPFAPAASRVFVRFKDPAGGIHGSTSVAVETE